MVLWLFRRRGTRKRSRTGAALSEPDNAPARSLVGGGVTRPASRKNQRLEPNSLHQHTRTYSFSPDRQDSIRVDRSNQLLDDPSQNETTTEENTQVSVWDPIPTLHHKRSSNYLMRRKSSKRRREDNNREAEIKAMSSLVPVRAPTDAWTTGGPTKHDHKRARTMGVGGVWDNPTDLSLPFHGSIRSSISSESEFVSYKISALDSLSPRPTLRCAPGPRVLSSSRASVPTRSGSQKRTLAEREPIPEETLKAHKRVDDLADDFDASELRELMERDARRREKQRQHEREKMERRLARRAEKQKREEAEARKSGTPPPQNLERGVMGRETVGLGIDPPSSVLTSSKQRTYPDPMSGVEEELPDNSYGEFPPQPMESFRRTDTVPPGPVVPPSTEKPPYTIAEHEEPISALPPGFRLDGALKAKASRSGSTLCSDKEKPTLTNDDDAATRKGSVASSKTNRLSFTNFLRWGIRSRRNSGGPSSFSNTSREEMVAAAAAAAAAQALAQPQAQPLASGDESIPAPPPTGNYIASRLGSGFPKRTRSRFREDLPELPLSPPDSRVQSPEVEPPLPIVTEHNVPGLEPARLISERDDTPTSSYRSTEIPHQTRTSKEMYGIPSMQQHVSMSLASIDSEGSWLSGRVGSQRTSAVRDHIARSTRQDQDHVAESLSHSEQEDLAIADDDYMSRLSPEPNTTNNPRLSGECRASSDEYELAEEGDVKWGLVGAHPQLISTHRHDRDTFHSREGLLNIDSGDEEDLQLAVSPVPPVTPGIDELVDLQHARSVRVGPHHVRNFSAGSAKLLEIRTSVDNKRRGQEKMNGGQPYT